jgi:hypothetical protein
VGNNKSLNVMEYIYRVQVGRMHVLVSNVLNPTSVFKVEMKYYPEDAEVVKLF